MHNLAVKCFGASVCLATLALIPPPPEAVCSVIAEAEASEHREKPYLRSDEADSKYQLESHLRLLPSDRIRAGVLCRNCYFLFSVLSGELTEI